MTENPEPKFCCSLWLYYIRFPKTVVNKMKIKMTKFLNTSCRAGPPTGGGYRADVSIATQLRASRTVSQIKLRARHALRRSMGGFGGSRRFFGTSRGQLPLEDIAFICQSQRSCGQRGRWFWLGRERVIPPRKGPPILLGKQRAPIRGISKGYPLGSLLHPFLERKGWRKVSAARWRCSAIGNKNACDATVLQIKPEARPALRRSVGAKTGASYFRRLLFQGPRTLTF